MESIRADLGLSYAQAGILLALLPAGAVLGVVLMAAADFVSRRALGAGGALVCALCLMAFATGQSFAALAVASILWGAASDAFVHATQLALAELAGDELDATLARTNLLGSVGDLLGPVTLAGAAATGVGWRPVFALSGVLMLLYAAWLAGQRLPPPRPDGSTPWSALVAVMRDSRVLRLAAIWTFVAALDEPFLAFLIATFQDTRGFSAAGATLLGGSIVLGGMAAFTVLAASTRQQERRRRSVVAASTLLVTAVVLVGSPWTPVVALGGLGFGAASAVTWVTIQVTVLRLRPGQVGTTQAVVSGLSTVGIVIPPLIGVAADQFGLTAGMWLYASVPAAILLLVLTDPGRDRSRA